ncbi:hypothetical protein F3Y22_tig00111008pilonHSYRG00023 [Hibiscus syriacus]|uniref:Uncharacterized protein n=1 Tax=Hibiscus syriacus TaxID=106335 RepID=A0A6A2Z737_HIBSY|nr:hypothetical protein F3Y22_tig00111008pilonHSYRG00023 [Hibiscus syriacus]
MFSVSGDGQGFLGKLLPSLLLFVFALLGSWVVAFIATTGVRLGPLLESSAGTWQRRSGEKTVGSRMEAGAAPRGPRVSNPRVSLWNHVDRWIVSDPTVVMRRLRMIREDPSVTPFVNELQRRIQLHYQANQSKLQNQNEEAKAEENQEGKTILPFEFVALEACLEAACGCLESEVRDELEHLLDDDDDMADMYLTEKQQIENSSSASLNERDESVEQGEEVVEPDNDDRH